MKSRLDQYLEATKMSFEDQRAIENMQRHIRYVRTQGDDSSIQDEVRHFQRKIRAIREKYMTPEDFEKESAAKGKAYTRQLDKRIQQRKERINRAIEVYSELSDRDKAIVVMFFIKNSLTRREQRDRRDAIINDIREAMGIQERFYTFRNPLSLKMNSGFWGSSAKAKYAVIPQPIIEVLKKYKIRFH